MMQQMVCSLIAEGACEIGGGDEQAAFGCAAVAQDDIVG